MINYSPDVGTETTKRNYKGENRVADPLEPEPPGNNKKKLQAGVIGRRSLIAVLTLKQQKETTRCCRSRPPQPP